MSLLRPDRFVANVRTIDFPALKERGVRGLLIDLDNTLLPRDTNEMPIGLKEWVQDLSASGFRVCLVSNNWHERVREVASELELRLVAKAIKPLPFAFWKATRIIDVPARECAVIGDQIFTDVLGGNLIGATTVLVNPLSATDLPHTLLLRRLESRIMKGMVAEEPRADKGAGLA